MPDHLGEQRVEGGVGLVAARRVCVGAHSRSRGGLEDPEHAARRAHGAVGADRLEVDAGLHREPVHREPVDRAVAAEPEVGERLARGEPQLCLHEVDAGDLLGDRVLDLQPGVRLDEPVRLAPDQELDGRRVLQARFACDAQGALGQLLADCGIEVRGGRDLDDLLVASLDAAVALTELDDVASLVAEHLHLDVADCIDELLDVQPTVAERGSGLGLAAREGVGDVVARPRHPHSPPATAGDRLDHHRVAAE